MLGKQIIGAWSGIKQKEIDANPDRFFEESSNKKV
jgi:hypothetical protein